jgi:Tol biopolymer transport system component
MSLVAGTKLGPYEIVAPLGAGGMGEVYRARDPRLGREVAIKVLPQHLSANPETRARFEREAKTVSSLNHPHICTLYDVGREGDTDYLVLELIDGETLAARLSRGPLPTAEVLRIGAQVADALDRAHRAGVIHRDLKPANVMLTKSGAKLMDFGLARAAPVAAAPGSSSVTMSVHTPSPTIAGPLTAEGTIVGTFQYMAPEQLEGAEADARSDLWALGCLLHEMATGKAAFTGRSAASLISAILSSEPVPVSQAAPLSPPALDRLVGACLAKDPADRVQSAHDVRLQLTWMAEAGGSSASGMFAAAPGAKPRAATSAWGAWFPRLALAVGVLGIVAAAFMVTRLRGGDVTPLVLEVPVPADLRLSDFSVGSTLSPDGTSVLAVGRKGAGGSGLWLWRLESPDPIEVPGGEDAFAPTWAPDGRSFAFSGRGGDALYRMPVGGGSPTKISPMTDCRGIAWGAKDVILYAPTAAGPLFRVPAAGGTPVQATTLDASRGEASHRFPSFLPDGEHFLFATLPPGPRGFAIQVGSLGSKKVKHVLDADCAPIWAEPGYLIFVQNGKIMAQRFDTGRLEMIGERIPLADASAPSDLTSERVATASRDGRLLYSVVAPRLTHLEWLSRSGASLGTIAVPEGDWELQALSPDQRFALATRDHDLWRVDLERAVATRLLRNFEPPLALSPTGDRIALAQGGQGSDHVHLVSSGGSGAEDSVRTVPALFQEVADWSPDGRSLMVAILGRPDSKGEDTTWDLWTVPLDGTGPPRPYLATGAVERRARISPDGKWALCFSTAEGQIELFIDSYPVPGRRTQVFSNEPDRAAGARWGPGGREVLYSDAEGYQVSLPIEFTGDEVRAGRPVRLFRVPPGITSLRTQDGQRFLISQTSGSAAGPVLRMVFHWPELLKQ